MSDDNRKWTTMADESGRMRYEMSHPMMFAFRPSNAYAEGWERIFGKRPDLCPENRHCYCAVEDREPDCCRCGLIVPKGQCFPKTPDGMGGHYFVENRCACGAERTEGQQCQTPSTDS